MRFRGGRWSGKRTLEVPGGWTLCAGAGGWRERGEASSPGPPGTKGLTLRPLASSREEGRAPGSDPSPGPALTSPSPFILGGRALVGLLLVFGTFKGTCDGGGGWAS